MALTEATQAYATTAALREGALFSHTPRARGLETDTYPTDTLQDARILQHLLEGGAPTARYVVGINRRGATPDSQVRDPRAPFIESNSVVDSFPLVQRPGSAEVQLIGAVTGPYVADQSEWHGMFLISRAERPVPTFGALSEDELQAFHQMVGKTLTFMEEERPDTTRFIGFSFSPLENRRVATINHPDFGEIDVLHPRSPVQNLASIHGHAIMMDESHLHDKPASSPEKFDTRMLREPALDQLTDIFRELVIKRVSSEFPNLPLTYTEHTDQDALFPKGSFISFPREYINHPDVAGFVRRVHQEGEDVYWKIADAIVDKKAMIDGRVVMRPQKEINRRTDMLLQQDGFVDLPEGAQKIIRALGRLKDPNKLIHSEMSIAERAKAMENFVLLGPAYNQLYYYQGKNMVIGWQMRWLSGASPFETVGVFKDQLATKTEDFLPIMDGHKATARRLSERLKPRSNPKRQRRLI